MSINKEAVYNLIKWVGEEEASTAIHFTKQIEVLERKWKRKFEIYIEKVTKEVTSDLLKDGKLKTKDVDFTDIFMEFYLGVCLDAVKSTKRMSTLPNRLAEYPKGRAPRSLKDLMRVWDKWKKKKDPTPRQKKLAEEFKKKYLKKVTEAYSKYTEEFRKGDEFTMQGAKEAIQTAAKTTYGRANTIVNTENTRYWNETTYNLYSEAVTVTHFLFVAIRDHRTTNWCKTRHGLVYRKDTEYLEKETPPCHWNCRSQILPLTPTNKRHKNLIDDPSIARENRRPAKLPAGWNK